MSAVVTAAAHAVSRAGNPVVTAVVGRTATGRPAPAARTRRDRRPALAPEPPPGTSTAATRAGRTAPAPRYGRVPGSGDGFPTRHS
ncbi:hypothetical protein [Streptomyces catenulae]|uniref:Uncharacterized protein n=1 Tax=Streptomyces catenulae TaxID=66875 RepID=A0ABV2YTN6_9ACTN|nr:hypothetical protein [Streptomyces catenulae]